MSKTTLLPDIAQLDESARYIQSRYDKPVSALVILGSGLGAFADDLPGKTVIPYGEIPHFPVSPGPKVEGHAGNLVLAELRPGFSIACMQGRFHYYEGHSMNSVVLPVRVARKLGAKTLVVTNAAGGINPAFAAGNLMLIEDHLNLMGDNPLKGPNLNELGPRFPDMSEAYSKKLRQLAEDSARAQGFELQKGVYAALSGPTYETPAEVRMLKSWGADAVGMSTVPEVIVANHMGMDVLGISCITNLAAGISQHKLSHDEVMETGQRVKGQFIQLLSAVLAHIPSPQA